MKLVIPCKDVIYVISQKQITYCSAENSYAIVFLVTGEEIIVSKSLSKISEQLNPERFIRVSQSYLVNMEHVNKIDKRNKVIELYGSERISFTVKLKTLVNALEKVNDMSCHW